MATILIGFLCPQWVESGLSEIHSWLPIICRSVFGQLSPFQSPTCLMSRCGRSLPVRFREPKRNCRRPALLIRSVCKGKPMPVSVPVQSAIPSPCWRSSAINCGCGSRNRTKTTRLPRFPVKLKRAMPGCVWRGSTRRAHGRRAWHFARRKRW